MKRCSCLYIKTHCGERGKLKQLMWPSRASQNFLTFWDDIKTIYTPCVQINILSYHLHVLARDRKAWWISIMDPWLSKRENSWSVMTLLH